jgi:3-hydroxybutyrate dehydrogenase
MASGYGLSGQAAIVTGSTSGIGQALARALAGEGVDVVLNGFGDEATIEADRAALEASAGVRVRYHGADMTKPVEIADMVAFARREFGRVDILVNNAGVQHVAPIDEFPIEKWDQIIAINLTSAFHAMRAAIPIMKAQGRGRIVNIASAHGLVASPFKGAYVAAKHGVLGLTKTVALEVAQAGITCNAICPGYVKTPLVEAQIADQAKARGMSEEAVMRDVILAAQPTKEFVAFDQLAGLLLYLVSDAGASANGAALSIDGGWTAA